MVPGDVSFKWQGADEFERNLRALTQAAGNDRAGKAAVRRAGQKALKPFVDAWQSLAPVLSGQYRDSIHTGTRLTRRQAAINRLTKNEIEVHAGTADPVALWQEFGTADHPAQPSGRPAWDQTKNRVWADFVKLIGEEIMKAAQRLQRKLRRRR